MQPSTCSRVPGISVITAGDSSNFALLPRHHIKASPFHEYWCNVEDPVPQHVRSLELACHCQGAG